MERQNVFVEKIIWKNLRSCRHYDLRQGFNQLLWPSYRSATFRRNRCSVRFTLSCRADLVLQQHAAKAAAAASSSKVVIQGRPFILYSSSSGLVLLQVPRFTLVVVVVNEEILIVLSPKESHNMLLVGWLAVSCRGPSGYHNPISKRGVVLHDQGDFFIAFFIAATALCNQVLLAIFFFRCFVGASPRLYRNISIIYEFQCFSQSTIACFLYPHIQKICCTTTVKATTDKLRADMVEFSSSSLA